MSDSLPRVVADGPLAPEILEMLRGEVEWLPWEIAQTGSREPVAGVYTYGHPRVDGLMMDRLPGLKIISNYGVGVDHIAVSEAKARGIRVGNTPGILDGATADLGFALLLAAGRRIVEGDRYARSPEFLRYDPGYLLGTEVHGQTLGIVGLGRIGWQIAQRARGFDMRILYHNRRPRPDAERQFQARYVSFDELLAESDYVMLTTPLTAETRGLINAAALRKMKATAILINLARGPVVDTQALWEALRDGVIYSAALDVTDPEPLPRDHPLLQMSNVTIVPHLGSATVQTRRRMAEVSVANLLAGLRNQPLLHEVL